VKVLEQVTLLFSEGKSDKVYEVDLLEVGAGQCVVNFRYGRRGTTLKDGTKTPVPVSQAEARRVFDKLVQSKVEAGYAREGSPGAARPPPTPVAPEAPAATVVPLNTSARERVLLEQLSQPETSLVVLPWSRTRPRKRRPLDRVIWRVGELRLRTAEPRLLRLLPGAEPMRAYCIAAALGRLGSEDSIPALGKLYTEAATPPMVRRMATEALLQLSDAATRREFQAEQVDKLPQVLREPARGKDPEAFGRVLEAHLAAPGGDPFAALETLYLVDSETVRPALLRALRTVPFTPASVRALRHIFKMAEYRRDGEVFGLLAHRHEKEFPQGRGKRQGFTSLTRHYLRRRAWRTLRRMGEREDADFVRMAVGVLLAFSDADAVAPRAVYSYSERGERHWDAFAPYCAFNHLLYGRSPRYEPSTSGLSFRLKKGRRPGGPPPAEREESFPKLWERTPQGLLHLLDESRCAPVHVFATRALRACPAFLKELDAEAVGMMLERPYEPTAQLGLELATARLDVSRGEPRSLLLSMARSPYAPAREQAFRWMDALRTLLLEDTAFLAGLVTAPLVETRQYARNLLRGTVLGAEAAKALAGRLVAALLKLREGQEALAADVAQAVLAVLGPLSQPLGLDVVGELLAHPLVPVQELGGELLLRRDVRRESVPPEQLMRLLDSPHAVCRALGLRLLGLLPDVAFHAMEPVLARMATSPHSDVRHAIRPLLQRLVRGDASAGARLVEALLAALLRRRLPEGVPAHVAQLLSGELASAVATLPAETVWRLLDSGDAAAQGLGVEQLARRGEALGVDVARAVKLAGHELLAAREWGWRWLEAHLPEVRADLATAVRLMDSRWDDARAFAFRYFRERFAPEDFTLEVLVSVADSVRKDVQAFGRELLTRSFREADGAELLLRLSEHPAPAVQLFATNYLERFAAGQPAMLEKLGPYFTRVLGQVNKGRAARSRVLDFLRREGQRNEASGRQAVELLHRLSATIAIENRAAALEAMLAIGRAQPSLSLPVQVLPVEVRRGV
jgi:predicted DNA-binding WGR domain protein